MGDKTSISWTQSDDGLAGATWNPVNGCGVWSAGCANCYAMRFAGRFSAPGERYHGLVSIAKNKRAVWTNKVRLEPHMLAVPLRWNRPRRVFVNSMSDLFHDGFSNEEIAAVFGVMAAASHHTFQLLTKRSLRMREWFTWVAEQTLGGQPMRGAAVCGIAASRFLSEDEETERQRQVWLATPVPWPLPNVWLGVSTENQDTAAERIPDLLATPAAIRFISAEPLIGPIDLAIASPNARSLVEDLDWVVAGCESGPGARACDIAWIRALRDQCTVARVAFFLKQLGDWRVPLAQRNGILTAGEGSKAKTGGVIELPYLDGAQHRAFPVPR